MSRWVALLQDALGADHPQVFVGPAGGAPMAEHPDCAACGRPVRTAACECGAAWPSARRTYAWLAVGVVALPVSAGSAYAAWTLARRTVLERPHLGPEGTATGAVLVGATVLVALAAPASLDRGLTLLRRRHRALDATDPNRTSHRLANAVDVLATRSAAAIDRVPAAMPVALVAAGIGLWVVAYALAGPLPRTVFVLVVLAAWVTVPIGIALDVRQRGGRRWDAAWAVLPYVAALVGSMYLFGRWRARTR